MADNDYFKIVAKILTYLYKKLKGISVEEYYLMPGTKDFPIGMDYFCYVIEHLLSDGYIEGAVVHKAYGGDYIQCITTNARITPKGIEYLSTNSVMRKIARTLKEAIPIISLFDIG